MNAIAPLADFDGAQEILSAWFAGMAPDPRETVWEWADRNVILPAISAAEAGRYDSSRTPYLRELLTNLSPSSPVMSTILMKGSQIGASQAGLVFVVYIIAVGGGPALIPCPTAAMAELYSKQRLDPLIGERLVQNRPMDARAATGAVFTVLARHVDPGQAEKVRHALPGEVQALWPAAANWVEVERDRAEGEVAAGSAHA